MSHQIHDAIRHLEKDMADILDALHDPLTTEIILNPRRKANGNYIGHILVEQHGKGLTNLLVHNQQFIASSDIQLGDRIVYSYSAAHDIIFWVKLTSITNIDFAAVALCLISYFTPDVICQTMDVDLLEYADDLRNHELPQPINITNVSLNNPITNPTGATNIHTLTIQELLTSINLYLMQNYKFEMRYMLIINSQQSQLFTTYPTLINTNKLVQMSMTKAETIMSVLASITGKFIHNKSPYLECQIPKYGYRFTGIIPPVVAFPAFCIRKHSPQIFTLDDFVTQGVLEASSRETLHNWIKRKFNILIAGGTGSGKTTLANALLYEISQIFPETRILIIEDVPELKFNTTRSVGLTVGEFFSMADALRTTLRFKPDRIVMGEIRGAEAYTLLKAWNTGHPGGIATIHANGVNEALYRFESCIRDYPDVKVNRQEIGFTINGIVSIQNITVRHKSEGTYSNVVKRKVTALRQILQYDVDKDIYQDIIYDQNNFMDY